MHMIVEVFVTIKYLKNEKNQKGGGYILVIFGPIAKQDAT